MQGIVRSTSHSEKNFLVPYLHSAESSANGLDIQPLALSYLKHHMVIGMLHGEAPEGR
jgi:hypothetical protein